MERVTLPQPKSNPNFIGSWIINPVSICDALITHFESNNRKQKKGVTLAGENTDIKDSVDILMFPEEITQSGNEVFKQYFNNLFSCYKDYVQEWPFLADFATDLQIGEFNIQRYHGGQHYQKIHTERDGLSSIHRLFAWMTYLNDVDIEEGGSTLFTHYDLEIQPKKGLTLIWPAEWTHAHKGGLLHSNCKYIITGWMHFPHNSG